MSKNQVCSCEQLFNSGKKEQSFNAKSKTMFRTQRFNRNLGHRVMDFTETPVEHLCLRSLRFLNIEGIQESNWERIFR